MTVTIGGECNPEPDDHSADLFDEEVLRIAKNIAAYRSNRTGPAWHEVEGFVRETVVTATPCLSYNERHIENVTAGIALFCHGKGIELTHDRVFDPTTIEEYLAEDCAHLEPGSRGNYRTWLDAISSVVRDPNRIPPKYEPIGRNNPVAPYGKKVVRSYRVWQKGLPTPGLRHNVGVLLAGSLGAGLTSTDYQYVLGTCVHRAHDGCVEVHVPGPQARIVVVRSEWEGLLLQLAETVGDNPLFHTGRGRWAKNTISNFAYRTRKHAHDVPHLNVDRLRATWQVDCLADGVPLKELADAAGVLPAALTRYMPWVPAADPERVRRLLRGEDEDL